jgi:hypothetical protein
MRTGKRSKMTEVSMEFDRANIANWFQYNAHPDDLTISFHHIHIGMLWKVEFHSGSFICRSLYTGMLLIRPVN